MKYPTFEAWLTAVDCEIASRVMGMTSSDLPDCCYAQWFEDGVSVKSAAARAIRNAKGDAI